MIAADTTIATAETGVHNRHPTDAGDLSILHRRNGEAAVVEVRSIGLELHKNLLTYDLNSFALRVQEAVAVAAAVAAPVAAVVAPVAVATETETLADGADKVAATPEAGFIMIVSTVRAPVESPKT